MACNFPPSNRDSAVQWRWKLEDPLAVNKEVIRIVEEKRTGANANRITLIRLEFHLCHFAFCSSHYSDVFYSSSAADPDWCVPGRVVLIWLILNAIGTNNDTGTVERAQEILLLRLLLLSRRIPIAASVKLCRQWQWMDAGVQQGYSRGRSRRSHSQEEDGRVPLIIASR